MTNLRREIEAEVLKQGFTKDEDKSALSLDNLRILGDLDLKHHVVERPIELENCEFEGKVDFRYCEFKQTVNFSGCTFRQSFNSGDVIQSFTIFRKDFIANAAVFKDAVMFNAAKCEGGMRLNNAEFHDKEHDVDFAGASIDKSLEFEKARFAAGANFNYVQCGIIGTFRGTRFWSKSREASFNAASFKYLDCEGAIFNGPASLDYSKVESNGNFRNARFEGEYTSLLLASFGTLDCRFAKFAGLVICNSLKCEGYADFGAARFKGSSVDFSYGSFGTYLECTGATFKGSATFENLECKYGIFPGARFLHPGLEISFRDSLFTGNLNFASKSLARPYLEIQPEGPAIFNGPASFDRLKCNGSVEFDNAWFNDKEIGASFRSASFGDLHCERIRFRGPVDFSSLRCDGEGVFDSTEFSAGFRLQERVTFREASFAKNLSCNDAIFRGGVSFDGLVCGGYGFFRRTTFHGPTSFAYASFAVNLSCVDAVFVGRTTFHRMQCTNGAFFGQAQFQDEGETDFSFTSYGIGLQCKGTSFHGPAKFSMIECGSSGLFSDVAFEKGVDFSGATFENLTCSGQWAGNTNLEAARVSQSLDLDGAVIHKLTLHQATIGTLALGDRQPLTKHSYADLRECSFQRFSGHRRLARELADSQHPDRFSRDPYLQLEAHYRNVGDHVEAKRTYFGGRQKLRENMKYRTRKRRDEATGWSDTWMERLRARPTLWNDWWLKWLTGYGVQTWRLLIPIVVVLIFGLVVFMPTEALEITRDEASAASYKPSERSTTDSPSNKTESKGSSLLDRVAYDMDLFLPVDLAATGQWEPHGSWREAYVMIHSILGWLLIPLLITSLAGIIRRQ